jgi:hypothetical protein
VFLIALLYAATAWQLARRFEAQRLPIPMGIMAILIVVLIPLATWAVQHALGLWPPGGAKGCHPGSMDCSSGARHSRMDREAPSAMGPRPGFAPTAWDFVHERK